MTTLKVLGHSDERLKQLEPGVGQVLELEVTHAVRLESRRAGTSPPYLIEGLQDDDVIELTFEEDVRRWVTVAEYRREFGALSRGGQPDELVVPARLPAGSRARGATTWVLNSLRVFGFNPSAKAAGELAEFYDRKRIPQPGLYRLLSPDQLGEAVAAGQLSSDQPLLVFIHGTISSTLGSFGSLSPEIWADLRRSYGDRIFGLDHYTLSQSPIQNALDLVKVLPAGARLHLVSHSRGGLVGELLCRSGIRNGSEPFDDLDLDLGHPPPIRQALAELSAELKRKKPKIERFVRVACPAGGTTLASGRLDRWLEIIVNVLGKLTGADASLVYGIATDLLLDIKKQGANPKEVPGLAAMVPTSTLVRMLNRSDIEVDADLTVIAGDIEGTGIMGRLGVFFADLYYLEDHDLVVHTRAMYGGAPRAAEVEARYFLDKKPEVSHFSYFQNIGTAAKLEAALQSKIDVLSGQGFESISEAQRVEAAPVEEITARSYQKRSGIPQPAVFVLPGIMGSHLALNGDRIWLDITDLALGGLVNLSIERQGIEAQAPVARAYASLIDYLSATHEVIPFPFDWRRSIRDEAVRFGEAVAAKLAETEQPVRILAHSMGGLVARAMFALKPEVWPDFCQREGSRLLMLGTPNRGSFVIPRLLLGRERILHMLALVDLKHSPEELLQIIVRFPGLLELLPETDGDPDFFAGDTWNRLAQTDGGDWVKPAQDDLDNAQKLRETLRQSPIDPNRMLYVAGWAPGTPVAIQMTQNDGPAKIEFTGTDEGDGRVPWRSGRLEGVPTWYMEAAHGDLASHEPAFPALYELLQTGQTTRLPAVPPWAGRAAARLYQLPDDEPEVFPGQADLEWAALAAAPRRLIRPPESVPVKVSVAHGNLSFCESPVAVGHYEGDGLYSAEYYLDHHLDGRLSARHRLGLYPGPEGTVEVVLNPASKPGGAIVVGLGQAGALSPQKLSNTFTTALLEYAVKFSESRTAPADKKEGRPMSIEFATLLVGAGEGGLGVADCIGAILNSVVRANRALVQMEAGYRMRIAAVQFIELYQDRAVQAVKELLPFQDQSEFQIEPFVQPLEGGRKRIFYREPEGWWRRLHIRAGRGNSLIFTASTDRARAEESHLAVQRSNIDQFVAQAVGNPSWDRDMAAAMFDLLIPNHLRSFSPDQRDVVLVVDRESARYPWELIHDRRAGYERPMVVEVGMIRQLTTPTFREQIKDVTNRNVLVVGDPINTPEEFVPLPGAEREARVVANTLKQHGFSVKEEIGTNAVPIITSLLSNDHRILHLAGHGVFRYRRKEGTSDQTEENLITGMVLGDGVFLTAVEIGQMSQVPELVFVNCCYLGVVGDELNYAPNNEFAASLAVELINMGVKAVVVAGWAVDDAAALTFAELFYQRILSGLAFGEAVRQARAETFVLHGDRTNTWGAYQCYGDPAYKLVKSDISRPKEKGPKFVAREEAMIEIENLTRDAMTASARGTLALRDNLEAIHADIERSRPAWLDEADLQEKLGRAYGELYLFEQAVEQYQAALASDMSIVSVKAVEQLANLRARAAVQKYEERRDPQAAVDIKESVEQLDRLNKAFFKTPERLSLIGSAYKRLAQISSGAERDEALAKMYSFYHEAWELSGDDPYPLTNALVAEILRYWIGELAKRSQELESKFETALSLARARHEEHPTDFWAAIGRADTLMARHLLEGELKKHQEQLLEQYKLAWKHFGSPRQLRSVIEQLEFLITVLKINGHQAEYDSGERETTRRKLLEALNFLWSRLAPDVEQ